MNVQNLEFLAFLFFDIVTIARNTLSPSVSPAYESVFEELGRALSDPAFTADLTASTCSNLSHIR